MKVLILGGTGAMGVHLVRVLSNTGAEVVVTSRSPRNSEGRVRYIQGNARDEVFLRQVLQGGWDAVVDFMIYKTESFERRAGLFLGGTAQYVFLSSARVYADSEKPITEDSPRLLDVSRDTSFLATDEYALSKARQENVLLESGSTNWTIIRPYITYSENRLQLGVLEKEDWLYRALHGRTIVFSKDINSRMTTLTYGLDVARAIAAVIGNPKALGESFHITSVDTITWSEVMAVYLSVLQRHLGTKPNVLLQELENFYRLYPNKHQIVYDRLFNRRFDNTKIGGYLDLRGFTKVETGLKRSLEAFLVSPDFGSINWKAEARKDKQVNERAPLSEIYGLGDKTKYLMFRI